MEDVRQADMVLKEKSYECDRLTHNEVMSSAGTEHTGKILNGEYSALWISTPNDYHVRVSSEKRTSHWQRIQLWIHRACILGLLVIMYGPPGFLWKLSAIQETMHEHRMTVARMRLCHFGDKFDVKDKRPSGSYLQVASTGKMSSNLWTCPCNLPIKDHYLDWYGRDQGHADWRRKINLKMIQEVCKALGLRGSAHPKMHAILDVIPLPSSISAPISSFPIP